MATHMRERPPAGFAATASRPFVELGQFIATAELRRITNFRSSDRQRRERCQALSNRLWRRYLGSPNTIDFLAADRYIWDYL